MANVDNDFIGKEHESGRKASALLTSSIRSKTKSLFKKRSGKMDLSRFSPRYRDGRLDRIVLSAPHYSFKEHFGSALKGTTPVTNRSAGNVKEFKRTVKGEQQTVKSHIRKAASVKAHIKGINYKAKNHIAQALKETNALTQLATELGEHRAVLIASQITF
jgi:glutamate racemase